MLRTRKILFVDWKTPLTGVDGQYFFADKIITLRKGVNLVNHGGVYALIDDSGRFFTTGWLPEIKMICRGIVVIPVMNGSENTGTFALVTVDEISNQVAPTRIYRKILIEKGLIVCFNVQSDNNFKNLEIYRVTKGDLIQVEVDGGRSDFDTIKFYSNSEAIIKRDDDYYHLNNNYLNLDKIDQSTADEYLKSNPYGYAY
jgi:hypothetical protein